MAKPFVQYWLLSLLLCAMVPAGAHGQSGSSQGSSSQEQAASQPQAPPAVSGAASSSSSKTEAAKSKKAKKVWTEDDMGKLDGKVNVVGDAQAPSRGGSSASAGGGDASTYRNKLAPLRQKLENIETQI